jgi:DNA (cytosine-5)-methyltransferase 1
MPIRPTWPHAAYGDGSGRRFRVDVGEAPSAMDVGELSGSEYAWEPLSNRALSGFISRARIGRLRYPDGFLERLEAQLR